MTGEGLNNEQAERSALVEQRESFRSRMFLMMIEIAFVFLIPALIAVFITTHFDLTGSGTAIALLIAFVFSWVVVVFRYRHAQKTLKALSDKIDNAR